MRATSWALLALLSASCQRSSTPSALKAIVQYEGFRPGCVHVLVQDAHDTNQTAEMSVPIDAASPTRSVQVAIYRQSSFSRTLQVTVSGRERDCDGQTVGTSTKRVELPET